MVEWTIALWTIFAIGQQIGEYQCILKVHHYQHPITRKPTVCFPLMCEFAIWKEFWQQGMLTFDTSCLKFEVVQSISAVPLPHSFARVDVALVVKASHPPSLN